jgi:hypothetical protein
MARLSNWEALLSAYLKEAQGLAMAFDGSDRTSVCAFFAAGAVEAITGADPVREFRGRFTTAAGAEKALRKYGKGTLEATIDAKFPERPVALARRGDLVWNGEAVGVCIGADAMFMPAEGVGLVRVPRAEWVKAWGVG